MAKNGAFFDPCGAKSWGSGGAPPTNLILLRNQRRPRAPSRDRDDRPARATGGPIRHPNPALTQPIGPIPWPLVGRSLVVGGWVGVGWFHWVLRRFCEAIVLPSNGGKRSTPITAFSASSLRSSARAFVARRTPAIASASMLLGFIAYSLSLIGRRCSLLIVSLLSQSSRSATHHR